MRIACLLVGVASTHAFADPTELLLRPGDSITIADKRYHCGGTHANGTTLSPGDALTVGDRRVVCKGDDKPATPAIAVTSTVDVKCLDTVRKLAGSMDAFALAKACRPLVIAPACKVTATTRDDKCIRELDFYFHPDVEKLTAACNRIEASCPVPGERTVTSQNPEKCVTSFVSSRGNPSSADMTSWLRSCNPAPTGKCIAISAAHDDHCWMSLHFWSNSPPADLAVEMVARCAQVQYRCE